MPFAEIIQKLKAPGLDVEGTESSSPGSGGERRPADVIGNAVGNHAHCDGPGAGGLWSTGSQRPGCEGAWAEGRRGAR